MCLCSSESTSNTYHPSPTHHPSTADLLFLLPHTDLLFLLLSRRYRHFFVRYDEPSYVKNLKVEILPLIAGDKNARDIAAELVEVRIQWIRMEKNRKELHLISYFTYLPLSPISYSTHTYLLPTYLLTRAVCDGCGRRGVEESDLFHRIHCQESSGSGSWNDSTVSTLPRWSHPCPCDLPCVTNSVVRCSVLVGCISFSMEWMSCAHN